VFRRKPVKNAEVNPAGLRCRGRVVNAFAQAVKRGIKPFGVQRAHGPNGVFQRFARDESSGETPPPGMARQEFLGKFFLGKVQEKRAQHD
jgi:hypothetical protein